MAATPVTSAGPLQLLPIHTYAEATTQADTAVTADAAARLAPPNPLAHMSAAAARQARPTGKQV